MQIASTHRNYLFMLFSKDFAMHKDLGFGASKIYSNIYIQILFMRYLLFLNKQILLYFYFSALIDILLGVAS